MKDEKEGWKVGVRVRDRVERESLQSKLLDEKQFGEKKLRERNLHGMSESQLVDEQVTIGLKGTTFFIESRHRLVYYISRCFLR